jgi:hypothetical protein
MDVLNELRLKKRAAIWDGYPTAYGYRVLDVNHKTVAQANPELLPEIPRHRRGGHATSTKPQIASKPESNQWFMNSEEEVDGQLLWIEVTMVNDPAGLWWRALGGEIVEGVAIPLVVFIPVLGLSILFGLRISRASLNWIAARAR